MKWLNVGIWKTVNVFSVEPVLMFVRMMLSVIHLVQEEIRYFNCKPFFRAEKIYEIVGFYRITYYPLFRI
jgi:hypothetical protein